MLGRGKGSRRFCRKEGRQDKRGLKLKQARTRQLPRQVPRTLPSQLSRPVHLETGTLMTRRRVSAGSAMRMSPAFETTVVQAARRYLYTLSSHMKNDNITEDLEMSPLVLLQARYCCVECAVADWDRHREYCVFMQEKIKRKMEAKKAV